VPDRVVQDAESVYLHPEHHRLGSRRGRGFVLQRAENRSTTLL
jgi:hypothetical protein